MKNHNYHFSNKMRAIGLLLLLSFIFPYTEVLAQKKVRKYATRQHSFESTSTVSNQGLAIDGNPKTASTLNVPLDALGILSATQVIDFHTSNATDAQPSPIAAGTPITVKLELPQNLLGIASGITIQPITNLQRNNITGIWSYQNVGTSYTGTNLLNLLTGAGSQELTITPNVNFHGIRITLGGVVAVGLTAQVYDAYIMENATSDIACNDKIDALSGVGSYLQGLANLATDIGQVNNPWNVIDGTLPAPTRLGYSLAQVGSYVYHTTIFKSPSVVGDSVRMVLKQNGTILSLGVLRNSLSIRTYNGNSAGTPIPGTNTSLIAIDLLSGTTDQFEVKFAPSVVFDRVELQLGALVDLNILTQPLDIISIERIKSSPVISGIGDENNLFYQFVNGSITLSSSVPAGNTLKWFNASTGGTEVNNIINPVSSNLVYWAQASETGCTEVSKRVPAYLYAVTDNSVLNPGTETQAYNGNHITANATGRSFSYSIASGNLPPGLTMASNGVLSGTPTTLGSFSFTVDLTDNIDIPTARTFGIAATSTGLTLSKSIDIGALPVTLTQFSAHNEGNVALLSWSTTEEVNSDRFEIMRSFNSKDWHNIGTVNSNGNSSNIERRYQFTDNTPANGTNYYRLKMIDLDGSHEMSQMASLVFNNLEEITIAPNPAVERIQIKTDNLAAIEKVELRNSAGLVLYNATNASEIDIQRLPSGLYVLSITRNGGRVTSHKVLKQ